MSQDVGYNFVTGTGLGEEALISTIGMVLISITLSKESRDVLGTVSTDIRKYMALGRGDSTDTAKYTDFDSSHADEDLVVLAEKITGINLGDQIVKAFWAAHFRTGFIIEPHAVEWARKPEITRRTV